MNSFWTLLDWFFPAIRLTDDVRLDDPEAFAGRSYALHARTLSTPSRSLAQPQRLQTSDPAGWHRQRERRKDGGREPHVDREQRESELVAALRRENEELRARVQQLERDLQLTRQSVAYAHDVSVPALPLDIGLPPPPKMPQSADLAALRTAYGALAASHASVQQALRERNEEVSSLRTYLTKTDDMSGAQLIQAIRDLNSEILQLAASVADEFTGKFDRRVNYARPSDRETLYPAVGVRTAAPFFGAAPDALAMAGGTMTTSNAALMIPSRMAVASRSLFVDVGGGTPFDEALMEDAFAGSLPQEEEDRVLCTVEIGLACVRKIEGAEESAPTSPTPEMATTPSNGANAISRVNSISSSTDASAKILDRNLLVKPKVMLDSVTKLLQL
ncbi:uncharacterized protein PHACADRAFT_193527 [Phanerochaete carnosa HHB-10118-sp]|uniref:Uncharacterized protein n=1 Tax=Phanerochaete carnosa (strain HHB-10118-sp) TaxID=650164 RepID=K5WH39_PHACS|nr:uncharacterized protein PHACADRAFT_193527 [Phanerochaete carnosa HHB-10118-sp]EKM58409.1 hypothetical protein PHACADRAFT_193527 [Phanerochaete carnosa HHB-10118-sp]